MDRRLALIGVAAIVVGFAAALKWGSAAVLEMLLLGGLILLIVVVVFIAVTVILDFIHK